MTLEITLIIISCLLALVSVSILIYSVVSSKKRSGSFDDNGEMAKKLEMTTELIKNSVKENITSQQEFIKHNFDSIKELNDKEFKFLSKNLDSKISEKMNEESIKILQNLGKSNENSNQKLLDFQKNINETIDKKFELLNKKVSDNLVDINKKVETSLTGGFDTTNKTIANVMETLGKIGEAQKNLENISGNVISLKNVLENNQTRGKYGEFQLSLILKQTFSNNKNCYEEQYNLNVKDEDGTNVRPDAVIKVPPPDHLICIDSKFPFQDYQKLFQSDLSEKEREEISKSFGNALKKHVNDVSKKYIVDGQTSKYAILFIPNEGIFSYIHSELYNIVTFARDKSVVLTSPSTLQPVLATLNQMIISYEQNQNLKVFQEMLRKLSVDFVRFGERWKSYAKSFDQIDRKRLELNTTVEKITKKFSNIKLEGQPSEEIDVIEGERLIEELDN